MIQTLCTVRLLITFSATFEVMLGHHTQCVSIVLHCATGCNILNGLISSSASHSHQQNYLAVHIHKQCSLL